MNLISRRQLPAVRIPGPTLNRPGKVLADEQHLNEFIEKSKNWSAS